MHCPHCEFTSSVLDERDAEIEIENHINLCHPARSVSQPIIIALLNLHYQYKIDMDELLTKFFTVRKELGIKFNQYDRED